MADVSRGRGEDGRDRDRGQILLVAGLAVAVTLVALVLLLNTVIYTQNLAARGTAVEDDRAVAFQQEAAAGVGEVVVAENRVEHGDWEQIDESVRAAVARYDDLHSRYSAERGTIADVEEGTLTLSKGTLLRQNSSSQDFTSAGDDGDWTLLENVSSVRNFRATVSGESLSGREGDPFTISLEGESVTRRFYVYSEGENDVAVSNDPDGPLPEGCTASGPEATVDLTAGTVGATDCPELDYPTGEGEYNVTFRNGTEATGTYELTVDLPRGDSKVGMDNFAGPGDEESPRAVHAVYDAEFDLHFETPTLEYHTTVRVAPGEPE